MAKQIGVLALLLGLCAAQDGYWTYYQHGLDWGGECTYGHLQSPIKVDAGEVYRVPKHSNISMVFKEEFDSPEVLGYFNAYTYALSGDFGYFNAYQHGHSGSKHKIRFNRLEFHSPAEHMLKDIRASLELQAMGVNETSKAAVAFSVLFVADGDHDNSFIKEVIHAHSSKTDIHLKKAFDDNTKIEDMYYYPGSLTHPPCTEGVDWYVWKDTQKLSYTQLDFFKNRWEGDQSFAGGAGNNRAIQPPNVPDYRYVIDYKGDDVDDDFAALLATSAVLALVFT